MKKVLILLLAIGLASCGAGLGTALGAPMVLQSLKIGNGTATGYGVTASPDYNTYTVSGTGSDIWDIADHFQFAYIPISGDFDIKVRTHSFVTNNTDGWSKAGLMVRGNLNLTHVENNVTVDGGIAPYALMAVTTGSTAPSAPNGLSWQSRYVDESEHNYSGVAYTMPAYLRLTRTGNIFRGFYSADGLTWTQMTPPTGGELPADVELIMTDPVYVGLAVSPHNAASLATAVFEFNYWGSTKPDPATGTTELEYGATIPLKWDALAYENGAIKDWKVYFGTEPNDLTATLLATVSEPTRETTSPVLAADTTYYWRVDATNAADANESKGAYWSFKTKSAKPVFTSDGQPVSVSAALNCFGSFTAKATSGIYDDQGDMTFVWKKAGGTAVQTDVNVKESTYSTNVLGTYYVEVTNKNGTTRSNDVQLTEKFGTPILTSIAIGTGAQPGVGMSVSSDGNTYTIIGSGDDIWNAADGFQFAYIPVSGDATMTARVVSISTPNTDNWAKAGVMFRETLTAGSTYAIEAICPAGNTAGDTFQYRTSTGGSAGAGGSTNVDAPYWSRISRVGNLFTGYRSPDGVTWTEHSSITIPMATNYYVGLAVCNHSTASLNTSVFDNIMASGAAVPKAWQASNPVYTPTTVPEGWVDPTAPMTASWTKSAVTPCGAYYKVYAGGAPDALTLFGQTAQDETQIVVPANTVPFNATIYWRVDTVYGSETVTGQVWSFDTVKQIPVIRTQPTLITVVDAGASADLNIVATTATVPEFIPMKSYQWYFAKDDSKVGPEGTPIDDGAGNYSCPITLTNLQVATEGEYYCIITNNVGSSTSDKGRVLTHRMMLHYNFESITNNVVKDQSQSKFDGAVICPAGGNGPIFALEDGVAGLGKAIRLFGPVDPNNGYVTTNKKPMELGISGNLPKTVSIWAKTYMFNDAGLFDMGGYDAAGQDFSLRTLDPSNFERWRVQYWGAPDRDFTIDSYNKWVHFVLVFDGSKSQFYVNGQQISSWDHTLDTQNANNVVLGRYQNDTYRFIGLLDDFRLYNYALTPQEAAQLYINVNGGSVCAVALKYDFNGDCKVDLNDFSIFSAEWLKDSFVRP